MDAEYIYKWIKIQLDSEIPKSEIVQNVVGYANLSREEAEKLVNDPAYLEQFIIPEGNPTLSAEEPPIDDTIITKLSGIEKQLKEMNKHLDVIFLSWFYVGLGILIGWLIWG